MKAEMTPGGVAQVGSTLISVNALVMQAENGTLDRVHKCDALALAARVRELEVMLGAARDSLQKLAKDTESMTAIALQNKAVTAYMRTRDAMQLAGVAQ